MAKVRADQLLVTRGLAESRTRAQALIMAGAVFSGEKKLAKAGDKLGRSLLVSAGQYILGPFGPECDLRSHGEAIAQRGGKNAKKRAAVAVARKLAVLMHRLWIAETPYDPHHRAKKRAA